MKQTIHELARILALKVRRKILSGGGGTSPADHRGDGLEFQELRDYQPEDDARYIHWPSLMSPRGPQLKVFREEQDFEDCIALDVSSSMTFSPRKWSLAAETAGLLAAVATLCGNGGDILLFADHLIQRTAFETGHRELRRATEAIQRAPMGPARPTDLRQALGELNNALHKPHRLFILSDFLAPPCLRELTRLANRHDTTLCQVLPMEMTELEPGTQAEVRDAETGRRIVACADSQERHLRAAIGQARQLARKAGANYLHLTLAQSPYQTLSQMNYKNNVAQL